MGKIEDFEVDGVEWIDGSVQADLPFQRISTLFNVSNFVVCQTNFHVVPFLNKEEKINKSAYRTLFQTIEWDIRSRALKLSGLGLFPKIFGHDISEFLHLFVSITKYFIHTLDSTNWKSMTNVFIFLFVPLNLIKIRQNFQAEVLR